MNASAGSAEGRLRIVSPEVSPDALPIRRRRGGHGFLYVTPNGARVVDEDVLNRIRSLAVPPAYDDVCIAIDPQAHIQAIGRDQAGRLQYRYHPDWEQVREARKLGRLETLCEALPDIRRRTAIDLRRRGLGRERVLAAVVTLIDLTHIRIGCEDYVHSGRSRGAATLLKRNVRRDGSRIRLTFRGKGGRTVECTVSGAALARVISELERLPGAPLFQFRDEAGKLHPATSAATNGYLTESRETK